MKKISSILFVIVCMTSATLAQSSSFDGHKNLIGIFGGLNIPRLSGGNGNELSRDYSSRAGGAFGLTCSIYVGSNFSLLIDALYSSEGGKRNGIQAFDATTMNPQVPAGTYFYANYHNESILNYFEIPVLVKYAIPLNKTLKFYVNAGPYIGILLNAKEKTSGSSIIYADRTQSVVVVPGAQSFDANTDITNDINSLNFGITGGGGISQRLSSGEVFVDLRGAYGLKVIQKLSENGTSHNGNMLIALGYALRF